jgi:hypothetical protein
MSGRKANERKYRQWTETEIKGRLYQRKVMGQQGWFALYFKEVDGEEGVLKFWQEIYDENGQLVEIHHKYPKDLSHQKINGNDK